MGTVWRQAASENPIQIIYRRLPISLRITTRKKLFVKDATQKSASMVQWGIDLEFVPRRPIFETCSHLREKGGVLTLRTPVGFALSPTISQKSKKLPDKSKFYKVPHKHDA
jgi:hypothetical protein